MTTAFLRASLDGNLEEAAKQVALVLPDTWLGHESVLALRLKQLKRDPSLQPWLLRAIGLRESGTMIGHIGFHSAPGPVYLAPWRPGGVEFGFTVFPPYRRRGYAREAAVALMQWARHLHNVTSFVVTISPTNHASQALAASLGFVKIGEHQDEIDGREDVLALDVAES
jgi:RimJ/RimL family protein N-acetyltransferase